tara:strand:+ start:486 stop:878 length:393 start_codon:yes stop_codon:yes gene_type:complete
MAAGKYSFVIEQGATTDFEVQYKDSSGTPVDLTNYHARMQIRSDYGGTLICSLTSSADGSAGDSDGTGLNLSGSNGTTPIESGSIGIFISAASSSNFNFGDAKYDLELVQGSTVTRLLEGKVQLSKNVTV